MAATRASIKCLARALGRYAAVSKVSSRYLTCSNLTVLSGNWKVGSIVDVNCGELCFSVDRGLPSRLLELRNFRTTVEGNKKSDLEADIAGPEPAPEFQSVLLPIRKYSPVLSGFDVLPNAFAGVPAGLSPPSNASSFNLEQLGREMSNFLSQGRLGETVKLFEDWLTVPDFQGKPKVPNIMACNLLLHAKLRLGVHPQHMVQVIKEMEMSRIRPNLLSYNFLLRAIFRQRNSEMAESILEKMEQSGTEAQPDGDSYNFVIVLCALERRIDAAMNRFHAMLDRGYVPSKTTYNELLLAAIRVHRTRVAVDILKDLKKRSIVPQLQAIIELAMTAAEVDDSECANLALGLLSASELVKSSRILSMDEGGMYFLLSLAARAADVELSQQAWSILRSSLRDSRPPNASSYLARLHVLALTGDFDTALALLRELESVVGSSRNGADNEIFSPFSSLRPLVLAFSRGGCEALDAAYYKLADMNAGGHRVTLSAVNCVIQGCANIWDFDRAYQTFETIGTTFGLVPDVHSCNSLLDVFGKARKMPEVLQIFSYMQEVGVIPDDRTYSLLVDAHVVNRDPKAAMDALDAMTSVGCIPQRQTLLRIWRRFVKQNLEEGAREVDTLMKKLGYRDTYTDLGRWQQIATI